MANQNFMRKMKEGITQGYNEEERTPVIQEEEEEEEGLMNTIDGIDLNKSVGFASEMENQESFEPDDTNDDVPDPLEYDGHSHDHYQYENTHEEKIEEREEEEGEEQQTDDSEDNLSDEELEELIDGFLQKGLLVKSGAYYNLKDKNQETHTIHGLKNLKELLRADGHLLSGLVAKFVDMSNSSDVPDPKIADDDGMAQMILKYVCKRTVENLRETYVSEMYTEKYTSNLFEKYLNDEIDASNPLFKELIVECASSDVVDPYLEKLTKSVLKYIGQIGD